MADTGSAVVRVDRRMYLTEDRERAVPEGDPDARFLLCVPGSDMLRADAIRYGLLESPTPEQESELQAPQGEPKRRTPAANKARTRPSDK